MPPRQSPIVGASASGVCGQASGLITTDALSNSHAAAQAFQRLNDRDNGLGIALFDF